ncbi:MAG: adenylate kinase [Ruminiclostridium sp.]|nr:adenylate kinase [Ruminiclostridium sp.]
MRLVLLGAPGAGKGTQAVNLSQKLKVPHISTGDIFRYNIRNGTPLGKMAKEYIDKGGLVPDEVTIGIVKDRLAQKDCSNGFILDGFPRTIPQAESLDSVLLDMGVNLDYAVDIFVPDTEIIRRLSGRRVCPACGMTYHIHFEPPEKDGACNGCGAALIQRDDDREATVLNRLETYHRQTEPLIGYYKAKGRLLVVDGQGKIDETTVKLLKVLGIK